MKPKTAQEYELEIEWLKKRNDVLESRIRDVGNGVAEPLGRHCYKLLTGDVDALEQAVTNHLDAGFRLHGSPISLPAGEGCGPGVMQAVVFSR